MLNNEPRHVEPMLHCIRQWDRTNDDLAPNLAWEVKYIMYLWLSHLMLAPFELSTLSTSNVFDVPSSLLELSEGLPMVAKDAMSVAFESLSSPSKARESAVLLLIRLALRRDMQAAGLPRKLAQASIKALLESDGNESTLYHAIGHLSLLFSITNLASDTEVAPFQLQIYDAIRSLITSERVHHLIIKDSAPARKLLVKTIRACLTHAINLVDVADGVDGDCVNTMLEDSIQYYLDALGDKDSPVRMAASKALATVALKLDSSMSAEIVEAVLGCLSENVLVDDSRTGQLLAKTTMPLNQSTSMRRNVSAVDALKWHGLMLTLGHLLFRRSPPAHQLPDIIEALLLGLEFEQRSNVGTSIGIGVRDGACFGIWAVARKYSTQELESINASEIAGVVVGHHGSKQSVLQLIAVRLVLSSCLDPSGNIRRGSSAALQELIGRHPDTISQGIPVVQVVDYHAVARRSRAVMEVAVQAARLDQIYHHALLEALLDWRGARAADADSRRWAATAMSELLVLSPMTQIVELLERVLSELRTLKPRNLGITAGARHGLLLCCKALIRSVSDFVDLAADVMFSMIQKYDLSALTGSLDGRTTSDLELVAEGVGTFLGAVAKQLWNSPRADQATKTAWVNRTMPILNRCLIASEKDTVVDPCAKAVADSFRNMTDSSKSALLESWLDIRKQKVGEMLSRGRLIAMAYVCPKLDFDGVLQDKVLIFLEQAVAGDQSIEVKTHAMRALSMLVEILPTSNLKAYESLCSAVIAGLSDYTNDQRGDVGSLLRLESLDAVEALRDLDSTEEWHPKAMNRLLPHVVRLAFEKLNKVRYRAWNCLRASWGSEIEPILPTADFEYLADVSTEGYFKKLMPLIQVEALRRAVLIGLSSSIGGGSDDVCRACCSALIDWSSELGMKSRTLFIDELTVSFLKYLSSLVSKEDREVVPALELFVFLVEQELVSESLFVGTQNGMSGVWETLQSIQVSNVSMERLGALIKLYQALLRIPDLRNRSLDKLTRQLLHRYPMVSDPSAIFSLKLTLLNRCGMLQPMLSVACR